MILNLYVSLWLFAELLLHYDQQELVYAGLLPENYDFELYKELVPMQPGDVDVTYADVTEFEKDFGFKPSVGLKEGLRRFVKWYKEFYR